MKNLHKIFLVTIFSLIFIVFCFILATFGYFAAWIHTYNVLTQKRPVAEITVSSLKEDSKGKYFELKYTPYEFPNALTSLFLSTPIQQKKLPSTIYKMYGDQFLIGGPIIKFYDSLILLNFKTIFKVGEISAKYTDIEKEKTRTSDIFSIYNINQGYEDWKKIQEEIQSKSLNGIFYNFFIETMQISFAGKFVTNTEQTYILYISNTGFFLDEK